MHAEQDFRKAYALDPNNAFAVNNIGYLSEIEGDRETAQFFYERRRAVAGANDNGGIGLSKLGGRVEVVQVAEQNDAKVEAKVLQERDARRARDEPVLLRRRDNSVVEEPATPPRVVPRRSRTHPLNNICTNLPADPPVKSPADWALETTFLEAADVRFRIVGKIAHQILKYRNSVFTFVEYQQQRVICRREPADKPEAVQRGGYDGPSIAAAMR